MTTAGTSTLEGILIAIEKVGDFMTKIQVWSNAKQGEIAGNITKEQADKMIENTIKKTQKNEVKDTFDDIYYNSTYGDYMTEGAKNFETIRTMGNVAGETGVEIAAGGAAGKALGTGAKAVKVGKTITTSSINIMDKFNKTAEKAVEDGVAGEDALSKATIASGKQGIKEVLTAKVANIENTTAQVASDVGIGATNEIADIAIDANYDDGYYNEKGKYVKYDKNSSYLDKVKTKYEEQGGAYNIAVAGIENTSINRVNSAEGNYAQTVVKTTLDFTDQTTDELIDPIRDIKKAGYENEKGEYVKYDKNASAIDKYTESFENNGGIENATNAGINKATKTGSTIAF